MDFNSEEPSKTVKSTRCENGVFCEICLEFNGEHVDVYGYCTDCREYLCKDCCEYHCKPKPLRDHKLVYKADMPELSKDFKAQSLTGYICPKMCEAHPDMPILVYCQIHRKQICKLCASMIHKTCEKDDKCAKETRFLSNLKLERTLSAIDEVQKMSNTNLAAVKHFSSQNEKQMTEAIDGVQKLTTILHSQIEGAMKDIVVKIKKLHSENKALLDDIIEKSEKAKIKVTELKTNIQRYENELQYSHLYFAVQNATEVTNVLKASMKSIEISEKFTEFMCRVDRRLYDIIENPEVFVLTKDTSEYENFPLYRKLVVPSEALDPQYVEGRITSYDYVYSFLAPQRKS